MARTTARPTPTAPQTLYPQARHCPTCGETIWAAYHNDRTITTLEAVRRLTLQIRRCLNRPCPQFQRPYRPEAEGRFALPKHEFGLDVIAWIGTLRYAQHRSLPEIHQPLLHRGVTVAPRTVTHLGVPALMEQKTSIRSQRWFFAPMSVVVSEESDRGSHDPRP